MRSLRAKLAVIWLLLLGSSGATGYLLYQFYAQSAASQQRELEAALVRGCDAVGEDYRFLVRGWSHPGQRADDGLRADLVAVVSHALKDLRGIEGGIWSRSEGSLAYAYPTYEGTVPKTDLPPAELPTIQAVNEAAQKTQAAGFLRRPGSSQVLVLRACPLPGPLDGLTAWAMGRAVTGQGAAYVQLVAGLSVLAFMVLCSALLLGRLLLVHSGRVAHLERALRQPQAEGSALPRLDPTGDPDLDRLVLSLNAAGERLAEARTRLAASERLAAFGQLAAGIAHEIRNPLAAMRLKAENALASPEEARRTAALRVVLDQVERLDRLLGDLLNLTQPRPPVPVPSDVAGLIREVLELQAESAARQGATVATRLEIPPGTRLMVDPDQFRRLVTNLVLNALQALRERQGGRIDVALTRRGDAAVLRVQDDGPGLPDEVRARLFEPFASGREAGSGLGLAIVRDIAAGHGGTIRSVPVSAGCSFEFEWPWRES